MPVISYIVLRGKCAFCSYKVPIRYLLVELFSAFLAVFCYFKWGLSLESVLMFVFFSLLLIGSLIDFETFTIPDFVTLGGLILGILSSPLRSSGFVDSLAGALVGGGAFLAIYVFYIKVRKMEGLGFGDVKLMAMIGSFTGVYGVFYAVLLGSIAGLIYALPMILKYKNSQFVLPYGPFLSLGVFLGILIDFKRFLFAQIGA